VNPCTLRAIFSFISIERVYQLSRRRVIQPVNKICSNYCKLYFLWTFQSSPELLQKRKPFRQNWECVYVLFSPFIFYFWICLCIFRQRWSIPAGIARHHNGWLGHVQHGGPLLWVPGTLTCCESRVHYSGWFTVWPSMHWSPPARRSCVHCLFPCMCVCLSHQLK